MGTRRTLSGWLTNRYLLIIRNEENFAEKRTISFNYARVLLILFVFFLLTLGISVYLVSTVLKQWLDPRYAQSLANRQLLELSVSIDSLENELRTKDRYVDNIRLILSGEDSIYQALSDPSYEIQSNSELIVAGGIQEIDSQFRAEYESSDLDLVKLTNSESNELKEMYLFTPIEGLISDKFMPQNGHFGVDIVAKENEPIKSVAEGIVIFSSWTLDNGYVMGIQHTRGNLISVYKHNSELLKNVGNFVVSGEIIAIIGNTGELTSGPHLHLELWHKGKAMDPENFIAF